MGKRDPFRYFVAGLALDLPPVAEVMMHGAEEKQCAAADDDDEEKEGGGAAPPPFPHTHTPGSCCDTAPM